MNKIVLLTGATTGIGKSTAFKLAELGYEIVFLARNKTKADQVFAEIVELYPKAKLDFIYFDLCSLKSIKNAADEFNKKYHHLDILINNAGGLFMKKEITEDGFEKTFQVNYLGQFYLTQLLIPKLEKAESPRIVNLSSEAHRIGKISFNNLNAEKSFGGWTQYGASKLMDILFTKKIANLYPKIKAFCCHPGMVRSEFGANNGGLSSLYNKLPFLISNEKGAETTVYLATENLDKLNNGGYYKNSRMAYSSVNSHDVEIQDRLWEISIKMLKDKSYFSA